jgi:DNA-binding transcriptional LysR family regulator
MRLFEIESFRAVMMSGTTRKAAMVLGVTQPAISQSIKRLETEAGFLLFVRANGRLHATPEAEALLLEVERSYTGMAAIEHRLHSLREFSTNQLEIASYPALGLGFLPRALAKMLVLFRARGSTKKAVVPPALPQLSLQVMNSQAVKNRIGSGLADLGLMADELSLQGLQYSVFAQFPAVVVMPRDHPLARHKTVTAAQLAETPFLALNPEDAFRKRLEDALGAQQLTLKIAAQTPFSASICEMALRGLGVGLVNPVTAIDYLERGLTMRRFALKVEFVSMLVIPPGRILSGTARAFLSAARQQLEADGLVIQKHLQR